MLSTSVAKKQWTLCVQFVKISLFKSTGNLMTASTWYLEKDHSLTPCKVVKSTPHSRVLRMLSGANKDKEIDAHPEGVAWGKMFPRVFTSESTSAPTVFVSNGRALQRRNTPKEFLDAVPKANPDYLFQPFLTDVIDSIHQGQSVILTGGAGVGKTTHITQLASRINQPLLRINFNGETRMSDLIGKVHVVNGETKWIDGVLPMAMRRGWWLLLDELDFAEPAVLSLLHPVLEDESILVLKENNGEIIRPDPNFRVFATANSIGAMSDRASDFGGTNTMNEAFLDRWQVMMVDNLPVDQEVKVLRNAAPGLKSAWARKIAEFSKKARDGEMEFTANFSTRKAIAWAKKTSLHRDPVKGAKLAWLDKMPASEQEPVERSLKAHFGTGKRTSVRSASVGRRGRPPSVKV